MNYCVYKKHDKKSYKIFIGGQTTMQQLDVLAYQTPQLQFTIDMIGMWCIFL